MEAGDKLVQMAHSELKQCIAKEAGELDSPFTDNKVCTTLKESPKGKSPGPDNIPAKVYNNLKAVLVPLMVTMTTGV
ncbi:hypothetical protein DSO57_1035005 [Entomophthora muscae]|uniref:Uncharacterized protein n=1 Tax=Entomophthora muscae TaxID=34485 RepID=A0ACC2TY85_9FUNG|nr:hypothetical protein DSO57_1035005 [Entomophthora muscae]